MQESSYKYKEKLYAGISSQSWKQKTSSLRYHYRQVRRNEQRFRCYPRYQVSVGGFRIYLTRIRITTVNMLVCASVCTNVCARTRVWMCLCMFTNEWVELISLSLFSFSSVCPFDLNTHKKNRLIIVQRNNCPSDLLIGCINEIVFKRPTDCSSSLCILTPVERPGSPAITERDLASASQERINRTNCWPSV